MNSYLKSILVVVVGVFVMSSSTARGQSGTTSQHGRNITCASDDGDRHLCPIATNGRVRMVNQRSGSPCVEGSTWGWDDNGIWVDRGCRADFVVGGRHHNGGYGSTITCSSNDGRRNYCRANTGGGVRMVNQRSGSPCIQGSTWGWDGAGVWVDQGCRADFAMGSDYSGGYNGGGSGSTITCSSNDGRRNYCRTNTNGGVQLSNQRSQSPCIQGRTWGWDGGGVWVDQGCRADFITASNSNGGYYGGGNGSTITCSSNDGRRNYCRANTGGGVRMVNQRSGSPCVEGSTWGWDSGGVWVDQGCRADFAMGR